ncbi:hypothetical protein A3Q56_00113 [Intoshia linei]|uniref:DUF1279 domain-containing protein n=1 Tax=Intoshia linei TaxID=1819745 RepID=A0A177BCT9_9BILA|nr:hypothetical protein A3Q56_00113 [Intoshia linei]
MSYCTLLFKSNLKNVYKLSKTIQYGPYIQFSSLQNKSGQNIPIYLNSNVEKIKKINTIFRDFKSNQFLQNRTFIQNKTELTDTDKSNLDLETKTLNNNDELDDSDNQLSYYQKFKKIYRTHGKILIAVHLFTCGIWAIIIYVSIKMGLDVKQLLSKLNITRFNNMNSNAGNFAVGYVLYKLISPIRYAATIMGTRIVIRYMRSLGYMPPKNSNMNISKLIKVGVNDVKEKVQAVKKTEIFKSMKK